MKGSCRFLATLAVAALFLFTALPAHAIPNWLPQNVNSAYGEKIDSLYFGIYIIVAVFFFLTEGLLLYCLVMFRARPGHKAKYMHGSNVLEVIWTVIPALILIGIGIAQAGTWEDIRMKFPSESSPDTLVIQTFPKQYDWQFRYAGRDGKFGTIDDVYPNAIHIKISGKTLMKLGSSDVIHSFFVPHARVKLDAVPGMLGRTWYTMDKFSLWDLKAQKMVIMGPEEIAGKKVAWSIQNGPTRDFWGYILTEAPVDDKDATIKTGMKKYSYAPIPNKTTVKVWYQGKVQDAPVGEVEYIFHRYEIACAELCGINHGNMRSYVYVDPPEVWNAWYTAACDQAVKTGSPAVITERWVKYWDESHPNWNRVIE